MPPTSFDFVRLCSADTWRPPSDGPRPVRRRAAGQRVVVGEEVGLARSDDDDDDDEPLFFSLPSQVMETMAPFLKLTSTLVRFQFWYSPQDAAAACFALLLLPW